MLIACHCLHLCGLVIAGRLIGRQSTAAAIADRLAVLVVLLVASLLIEINALTAFACLQSGSALCVTQAGSAANDFQSKAFAAHLQS